MIKLFPHPRRENEIKSRHISGKSYGGVSGSLATLLIIRLLSSPAAWATEPPFLIKEVKTEQDAQAINENLRALSDGLRKLNTTVTTSGGGDVFLANTQTFTGGNTFNSSFTVRSNGGLITLSTASQVGHFNILVTSAGSLGTVQFYPGLSQENSGLATVPTQSFAGVTTFKTFCLSGSTLTATFASAQSTAWIAFNGSAYTSVASAAVGLSVLEDGNYLVVGGTPFNNTRGMSFVQQDPDANGPMNVGFSFFFFSPGVGAHTFCITPRASAGTVTITDDNVNRFTVTELR